MMTTKDRDMCWKHSKAINWEKEQRDVIMQIHRRSRLFDIVSRK